MTSGTSPCMHLHCMQPVWCLRASDFCMPLLSGSHQHVGTARLLPLSQLFSSQHCEDAAAI